MHEINRPVQLSAGIEPLWLLQVISREDDWRVRLVSVVFAPVAQGELGAADLIERGAVVNWPAIFV
jgi:hypothetical protein